MTIQPRQMEAVNAPGIQNNMTVTSEKAQPSEVNIVRNITSTNAVSVVTPRLNVRNQQSQP